MRYMFFNQLKILLKMYITQRRLLCNNLRKINALKTFLVLFLLVFSQSIDAQSIVSKHGRLRVKGNKVVNKNNEAISLAGNSLFWSNAGDSADFYNAQTVQVLNDEWNSDIVRVAMGVKESWDGGTGYINSPNLQMTKIRKVIDAAIAEGMYVIIDWHTHDAENYTSRAAGFFKEVARLYGNKDNIIYEVYNEPIKQSWGTIKSYSETVIQAIRSEDPDNLIIVGTPTWSQDVDKAAANPIKDNNTAYTLHFYSGTHKQWLRDKAAKAMQDGIALFVTEWGAVNADGDGAADKAETQKWIDFMKKNGISHANWSVSDKNEGASIVSPGKGVNGLANNNLTATGTYIKGLIKNNKEGGSGGGNPSPTPNKAPNVSITNPSGNRTVDLGYKLQVDVSANDSDGNVSNVKLYINNKLVRQENSAPYNWGVNESSTSEELNGLSAGSYTFKVVATDNDGATAQDTFTLTVKKAAPPVATVDGGTVASTTNQTAITTTTGDGVADLVTFKNTSNASASYRYLITDANGNILTTETNSHDFEGASVGICKVYGISYTGNLSVGGKNVKDGGLASGSFDLSSNSIVIDRRAVVTPPPTANKAPAVSFKTPSRNTITVNVGYKLNAEVNASDADGSIANVKLYIDNKLVRQERFAPYEWGHATSPNANELNGLSAGTYTIKAIATDNDGATAQDTFTLTVKSNGTPNPTPPTPPTTGGNCSFGAPTANALASIPRAEFKNVHVLGTGGPNMSNIRRFTINWNNQYNGLYQFSMNTNDGKPSYWIDFRGKVTHTFKSANPGLTISGSGISGLDGSYYVTRKGSDFVLVSKGGKFSIYFSNSSSAPSCSAAKAANENGIALSAFPVPATDTISFSGLEEDATVTIIDITGKKVLQTTISKNATAIDISELSTGSYFATFISQANFTYRNVQFVKVIK